MYPYGLIGNCSISALISDQGSLDWLCLPRPDSEPVFGRLLDPHGGHFDVHLHFGDENRTPLYRQYYLQNSNILVTEMTLDGSGVRITDFAPRFEQYGRMFRPTMLFRKVEPIQGHPLIQVEFQPIAGWDKQKVKSTRGNSHLRYDIRGQDLRLTSNMPLTYLEDALPFKLESTLYFALTWGVPLEEDLVDVSERFFKLTHQYWQTWVKHCSIPTLFQQQTIRSALALKLHCYEDTGAILAATTTSLPEEPGHTRNWDYRYCWLRDAYFVLSAFRNLGHFEEMEGFLKFLLNIAHQREELAPVYTLSQGLPTPEKEHPHWKGFLSSRPVRTYNQAAEHIQNDVYGEMILTLAPIYLDERFQYLRTRDHDELLVQLGHSAVKKIGSRDAGLWEIRNGWQEHSFTNLMCWAGLDRLCTIQDQGHLLAAGDQFSLGRELAHQAVLRGVQNSTLVNGPLDASLDASLCLASVLRFPDSRLCENTVSAIQDQLSVASASSSGHPSYFYRYLRKDDFGTPQSPFLVCSFWMAQALARSGKVQDAQRILTDLSRASNTVGLFAEHFHPDHGVQLGNFPQTYSHVGMINAAFDVSPKWGDFI